MGLCKKLLFSGISLFVGVTTASGEVILGDANSDGIIDIADANYVGGNFANINRIAADVNGDGIINEKDALGIADMILTPPNIKYGELLTTAKQPTGERIPMLSEGVYSWFVGATSWRNLFFRDANGTVWGNDEVGGKAFNMTTSSNAWNLWYPEPAGCYYSTFDTIKKQWSAMHISKMTVSGDIECGMQYNAARNSWISRVNVDNGEKNVTVKCDVALYNSLTGTDKPINSTLYIINTENGLSISTAPSTLKLNISQSGVTDFVIDASIPGHIAFRAEPVGRYEETTGVGTFAKGADIGWLTQLESEGAKFLDKQGNERECMDLLRDECGVNSIRMRVWVNPTDGWNNIDDVAMKASRAAALGLRVMIDFHYSDTWADPGHQTTPEEWSTTDIETLKAQMTEHTVNVLKRIKALGVTPEWVQVGNETRNGFMYPLGQASTNATNFAALVTAGNDAVKSVFPNAKTIVHLDSGQSMSYYTWLLNILKNNGARYDMVGMSLYPDASNWQTYANSVITNINTINKNFGKETMLCEIGFHYSLAKECASCISTLMKNGGEHLRGIFYWEPEAPIGYSGGYDKGCFINSTPTEALSPFCE